MLTEAAAVAPSLARAKPYKLGLLTSTHTKHDNGESLEAIRALLAVHEGPNFTVSGKLFLLTISQGIHSRTVVVRHGEKGPIVGMVTVFLKHTFLGTEAHLETLAVLPEHRRRGLAKEMLDEAIRWARVNQADMVQVICHGSKNARTRAIEVLYAAGFKQVEQGDRVLRKPLD